MRAFRLTHKGIKGARFSLLHGDLGYCPLDSNYVHHYYKSERTNLIYSFGSYFGRSRFLVSFYITKEKLSDICNAEYLLVAS